MSRELAVRVPSEIGAWVRQQPGSCTETAVGLAKGLWKGRQGISLGDPGPGDDRLKFRVPVRVLQFLRVATHSRDTTAALRKLLRWGYQGGALPASPSLARSLPAPKPIVSEAIVYSPARASGQLLRTSDGRAIQFGGDGRPIGGDAALFSSPIVGDLLAVREKSALACVDAWPLRLLECAAQNPLVVLAVGWMLWKAFRFLWPVMTAANTATAAGAVAAAPKIAGWLPKVASGLGELLS
jgi:hypothetical protein